MVTFAGRQSELCDMLRSLVELSFDAMNVYDAASPRLDNETFKSVFEEFRHHHSLHARNLSLVLQALGADVPTGTELATRLRQGEEVISNLAGDVAILLAMRSNESDIAVAYEHALDRDDLDARLAHLLEEHLHEERHHRNWIEAQLSGMGQDHWDDEHQLEHFVKFGTTPSPHKASRT